VCGEITVLYTGPLPIVLRTTSVVMCTHWVLSPVPSMQGMYTPLTAACGAGHVAIVELLIKAGADMDDDDLYWMMVTHRYFYSNLLILNAFDIYVSNA
jgi:hypothetical protein